MNLQEKYEAYKEFYYNHFIIKDSYEKQGALIPFDTVDFDSKTGFSGDGTINIAYHLQYLFSRFLNKESVEDELYYTVRVLYRLSKEAYNYYRSKYPRIPLKFEPGFFLRDDIRLLDAKKYELESIISSYTMVIEKLVYEDPCHSAFVSQDQLWNLAPILVMLNERNIDKVSKNVNYIAKHLFSYPVQNNYTLYNPYTSTIRHYEDYIPSFTVPYYDRCKEREKTLKYTNKVKRGANLWYFSGGFKAVYKKLGGSPGFYFPSLFYNLIVFGADRIVMPLKRLLNKETKENSYYCLGVAGDKWYNKGLTKRLIKRFNKSLEESLKKETISANDLFMPHLVFLQLVKESKDFESIDIDKLSLWLDKYPESKKEKRVESPIIFLTLSEYLKLYKNEI